ncbi:MAG: hypothetical protein H7199_03565 [Burkholderiales bacterium]|nr:hypothetical protein [Flavobacterium sp.]
MRKLTMLFLPISFLLVFISCGSSAVIKDYTLKTSVKRVFEMPYFSNPEVDYVYKANIQIYGKELTGIFIAKRLNQTTHRIVFTTEFGNKLMDFEISEAEFKINFIVSEFDKKMLTNTLKSDFRLLLRNHFEIEDTFENAQNTVYKSLDGNQLNYLFVSKTDGKFFKIIAGSKRKEKINLSFTSENNIFAQQFIFQHYNIKLRMEFNYFKP